MGRNHKNQLRKNFLLKKNSFIMAYEKIFFITVLIFQALFIFTKEIFDRKLHFLTF